MSDWPYQVPVPEMTFEEFIAEQCPCWKCVSSFLTAQDALYRNITDEGDSIPNAFDYIQPYQDTVTEPWQQGYTTEPISGSLDHEEISQRQEPSQLLRRLDSATGIEEPAIFDNQSEDGAQIAAGSSRPSVPPPPTLMIEEREVGRKTKRRDDEVAGVPPQKRRHLEQPRSHSPAVAPTEAPTSGTGEGEGENASEEGLVSDGHAGAAADGVTSPDETPVDTAEAGPSVPAVANSSADRRRYRPRQLKARKGHNLEELGLPPLNAIEEVGQKMTMAEKLEYVLSRLGRAALQQEIAGALDAGWPDERINRASINTLAQALSHKPMFVGYTSPYLRGTFWTLEALTPPTEEYPQAEFGVAAKGRRGQHKKVQPQGD